MWLPSAISAANQTAEERLFIDHLHDWLTILLNLTKFKISLLATFTTATGYILCTGRVTTQILTPVAGILLLACGSSALNHYQENRIDARMERTWARPIPAGKVTPLLVLILSFLLILTGSLILLYGANPTALALGNFAVFWYNGVYTRLKQKTAFAVFPGSLVGAIPPAVGWVAAEGSLFDPRIIALCFFFFLWQVPHFWLLLLLYGIQYEKAGLPSLTRIFTRVQLIRITYIWIIATAVASLFLPLFGVTQSPFTTVSLLIGAIGLVWCATKFLILQGSNASFSPVFRVINLFALLVMLLLSLDSLLS